MENGQISTNLSFMYFMNLFIYIFVIRIEWNVSFNNAIKGQAHFKLAF